MILRNKYINQITQALKLFGGVFLVGHRQVGKTTIMKSLTEFNIIDPQRSVYITMDEILVGGSIIFDTTDQFINYVQTYYKFDRLVMDYILIDEFKNIKNFNLLIKSLIDKYPHKKFICTSSGNYQWTNEVIEGLAGRAHQINIYPLDWSEYLLFKGYKPGAITNYSGVYKDVIDEYMIFGGYPAVVLASTSQQKKLILKSIIDSTFIFDIKTFLKEEQVIDFRKLFVYLSDNIGSLISYDALASKLSTKSYHIKKYIDLLINTNLVYQLTPYFTNPKKELTNKVKLYLSDFGIMNFMINRRSIIDNGAYIEMFVANNLFVSTDLLTIVHYWQNRNETEIDLIWNNGSRIIPIECKANNKDIIPKAFRYFDQVYGDRVDYYIKTSLDLTTTRALDSKDVRICPFWNVQLS